MTNESAPLVWLSGFVIKPTVGMETNYLMATYYTVVLGLLVLPLNCCLFLAVGTAHVICLCDMSRVQA